MENESWLTRRRRRWRRERRIAGALIRHGVGLTLAEIGLGWLLPFQWGIFRHKRRRGPYSGPEHLRMAFEELGPTFIKLAQILSTRGDLIGPQFAAELAKLRSAVPPTDFAFVAEVIDAELSAPRDEVLAEIDEDPIGSASIAQVYRARLLNGDRVVLKVQRPGARETVALDLEILRRWAIRAARGAAGASYDIRGFFEEFAFTLTNELDYSNEASNASRLKAIHADDPAIFIPSVHEQYSTTRLLVLDEVVGDEFGSKELDARLTPERRSELAAAAIKAAFTEVFLEGFFHADPHPGNFIVMEDMRVGLIDFGMVGSLTERQRRNCLDLAYAMGLKDSEGMLDALWALGVTEPEAHRRSVARDFDRLFHRIEDQSFEDLAAVDLIGELMRVAHRQRLEFPPDLALLFKVIAMLEHAAVLVDPRFPFFRSLEPHVIGMLRGRASPGEFGRRMGRDVLDLARLTEGLPRRAGRLLQRLEAGDLEIAVRDQELELEVRRVHRALNRLTLALGGSVFLVAVTIGALVGEVARPGSMAPLLVALSLGAGGMFLGALGAWMFWSRRR